MFDNNTDNAHDYNNHFMDKSNNNSNYNDYNNEHKLKHSTLQSLPPFKEHSSPT